MVDLAGSAGQLRQALPDGRADAEGVAGQGPGIVEVQRGLSTEYLAASILDQKWHQLGTDQMPTDVLGFEATALHDAGVDFPLVPPRYRTTYFSHVFSGGYSAGYYGYLWAEKLDADTVEWFKENGGLLRKNGDRFRQMLLSRGGTMDAMDMYRNFRGRDAKIEPLLERRGLTGE